MSYIPILMALLVMTPPVHVLDAVLDAREENNPVLPDDLKKDNEEEKKKEEKKEKKRGDTGIVATWIAPPAAAPPKRPSVTLYTADGSWCAPCLQLSRELGLDKKKRTVKAKLPFTLRVVLVPAEGKSPTGSVPCLRIDGTSKTLRGYSSAGDISAWYNRNAPAAKPPVPEVPKSRIVELRNWTDRGDAVARALVAHISREAKVGPPVGGFFDPAVDVDIEDSLVRFINALATDGATIGPARVLWPKGKMHFVPPARLTVKKIVNFKMSLAGVYFDGSEITFCLDGFPDLIVRLK